jgi:hypothetical protein
VQGLRCTYIHRCKVKFSCALLTTLVVSVNVHVQLLIIELITKKLLIIESIVVDRDYPHRKGVSGLENNILDSVVMDP